MGDPSTPTRKQLKSFTTWSSYRRRTTSINFIVIECAGLYLATETFFRKSNNIDTGKIKDFPT